MSIVPAILEPVVDKTASPRALKESWRYSHLRPVEDTVFAPAAATMALRLSDLPAVAIDGAARLVFINGVRIPSFDTELPSHAAWDRNCLVIGQQPQPALPIELLFITTPDAAQATSRAVALEVKLAKQAAASLIERHLTIGAGAHPALTTMHLAIDLAEQANLKHLRLQECGPQELHFARTEIRQAQGSCYQALAVLVGGLEARHEIAATLMGERAECQLGGLYILDGDQRGEIVTSVLHQAPRCQSEQAFRGIVAGKAKGSYLGKIAVAKDAQKTLAYQSHKALPLSPQAEINARPELEILADDVKCSHGVAIGALDAEALFYMQSRGISKATAQLLLVEAFAETALDTIKDPGLKALALILTRRKLGPLAGGTA